MKEKQQEEGQLNTAHRIGLLGMIGVIVSAMVGGGIFSLPQNMASDSEAGGVLIAWILTALGMWFIANSFNLLSQIKPELTTGIYKYAQEGFGDFMGFFSGFGYWLANCLAMTAYAILIMETINSFFPYFEGGNNIASILIGSVLVWVMYFICLAGVRSATILNMIGTIAKLVPVVLFLIVMILGFRWTQFTDDFWGKQTFYQSSATGISHSLFSQVKSTMLVVMWLFIGIEGATVVSGRAKSKRDVGKATVIGFLTVLGLYAAVALLPFGIYSQEQLSQFGNPSMAQIMGDRVGAWGLTIINAGVLISILSAWLAWMIMLGEVPYAAAQSGTFPKAFLKQNKKGANSTALLVTTCVIQGTLLLSYFAQDGWNTMISITSAMALPCYFFSCFYLLKLAWAKDPNVKPVVSYTQALITGALGSLFALFILYSAGIFYLSLALIGYALGVPLYIYTRVKEYPHEKMFTLADKLMVAFIYIVAIGALISFWL